jgi:transposase
MVWRKKFLRLWIKEKFMTPAPTLVGVELNPGPSLSEDTRKDIIRWKKEKESNYAIAGKLKVNVKTVRKWVKRCFKKPSKKSSFKNRPGQGRKRKLTKAQERQIVKKAKKEDAPQIAHEVSKKVKGGISEMTVRRVLKKRLRYLVREKREAISLRQAERRFEFAKRRLKDKWKYALFVDEKTFQVGASKKKSWQDPQHRETDEVKRHPKKIHVWGGIGLHFKTKLYFFEENLDSKLYCKILNNRLPPAYSFDIRPQERHKWVLVQDNDPKHTSGLVKEVLDKKAPNRLKDWPSNSPDFNPIEDVWSMMEHDLEQKTPKTIQALRKTLTKSWENLDMKNVMASIESLPRRLEQCIELKGQRTSY